jgi:hypothetical protein
VENLLNPSFCGILIRKAAFEYKKYAKAPLPYALIYLILPLALHSLTRKSILKSERKKLHTWLQENPEVKIQFAERVRNIVPIVNETLVFLFSVKAAEFDQDGNLNVVKHERKGNLKVDFDLEVYECAIAAGIIGRWFAKTNSITTIYAMFGVKP